jgi:FkbM family methyltransferase
MLIFDIGYNAGDFSDHMLQLYPDAKIVAMDGDPSHKKNDPSIEFICGVISDVDGVDVDFYSPSKGSPIASINTDYMKKVRHSEHLIGVNPVRVRSYTLDSLISVYGKPDIIKLDVEGAELAALRGLHQKCGVVLFEWCEELYEEAVKCVNVLKELGYSEFANHVCREGDAQVMYVDDIAYESWDKINGVDIVKERKNRWGMIYAR